jgi:hypothetical protein
MGFSLELFLENLHQLAFDQELKESEIIDNLKSIIKEQHQYAKDCGALDKNHEL